MIKLSNIIQKRSLTL